MYLIKLLYWEDKMKTPESIELTDEELRIIINAIDLGMLLRPIKEVNQQYKKYDKLLGNKDKNSKLVQKNLPNIAFDMYRKRDVNFVKLIDAHIQRLLSVFDDGIKSYIGQGSYLDILREYSAQSYYSLLKDFEEKDKGNNINLDLFFVQLKLSGIQLETEKKQEIVNLWNGDNRNKEQEVDIIASSEKQEEVNLADVHTEEDKMPKKSIPQKVKAKKLTAQEKAEKHKQALKEKELAKKAEEERKKQEEQQLLGEQDFTADDKIEETTKELLATEEVLNDNAESEDALTREDILIDMYVGHVEIVGDFYNFKPIGRLINNEFEWFNEAELNALLPLSMAHNINLYYEFWDSNVCDEMRAKFKNDNFILVDFEEKDLKANIVNKTRNELTAYKIDAFDLLREGRIKYLSDVGYYRFLNPDMIMGEMDEIDVQSSIKLKKDTLVEGEKVFLKQKDGLYVGPCEVKRHETKNELFINVESDNHILSGYKRTDFKKTPIASLYDENDSSVMWTCYSIKDDAVACKKDLLSDQELLEAFRKELNASGNNDIYIDGVDTILEVYKNSAFSGRDIPEDIRLQRVDRIKDLLSAEAELSETFANIADVVFELIVKNKDNPEVEVLMDSLLEKRPELLENIQSMKIIKSRMETARRILDDMEEKKKKLEAHNEEKTLSDAADARSIELNEGIKEKQAILDKLLVKLGLAEDINELESRLAKYKEDEKYYKIHSENLKEETKALENTLAQTLNNYSEKLIDVTFDGYISSKLLQAASNWEETTKDENLKHAVNLVNEIPSYECESEELVDYLVKTIQKIRPKYSRNVIINIFVCTVQGFLTVLSGAPGCGKTSMCNILSKVLGLTQFEKQLADVNIDLNVNRYIQVSVERGWTSKRDFVGYYNPLTKMFEESNREVFEGLKVLDIEAKNQKSRYPFYILLDEANLSPMEYYWADFMNICDDLGDNHSINLGNNNVFTVPETLHFLATINNDHTTETLSPRLIDRAWIINLPQYKINGVAAELCNEDIKQVSWESLEKVFANYDENYLTLDGEEQKVYDGLKEILMKQNIFVSPRADIAIYKYWNVASKLMVEEGYNYAPSIIALDYAVVQKILPRISGAGEEYKSWLEELKEYCKNQHLTNSQDMLDSIISRGDRQMKYYEYFVKG